MLYKLPHILNPSFQERYSLPSRSRFFFVSLDTLCRSYIREFGQPDESNITWQEIVEEYTKTHARYISAIYFQLRQKLGGDDIVVLLSEPCWQLGYDAVQRSIYLYKTCPRA